MTLEARLRAYAEAIDDRAQSAPTAELSDAYAVVTLELRTLLAGGDPGND